ncbi:MAG: hypothetical protein P8Z39_08325 [Gammaproteobacteria bacterium]
MNQLQATTNSIASPGLWIIALLLVIEAIGTSVYVPQFSQLFQSFGGELPFLTKVVLIGAWAIWVLPILASIVIMFTSKFKTPIIFAAVLLFIGVLWIPTVIYGLYLPVLEMSEVELP